MRGKLVWTLGKPFIYRLSTQHHKLHLIVNDDLDGFHTHPWDFKSLILFGGYVETLSDGTVQKYSMFSINRKVATQSHQIRLFRICGIKIPTLTVGWYGPKTQLCSFCQELGYCKSRSVA